MSQFHWILLQTFAIGLTIGLVTGLWIFKVATDERKPRYLWLVWKA